MILPLLFLATGLASLWHTTKKPKLMMTVGGEIDVLQGLPYQPGSMGAASLVRLLVRAPPDYVQQIRMQWGRDGQKRLLQDVRERVVGMGSSSVLLATQDPTNNLLVKVIARGMPPMRTDGVITILTSEVVEDNSKAFRASFAPKTSPLDIGMSAEDQALFEEALFHELNPRHLRGVAQSLEPSFVCSASVLRAKGTLIDRRIQIQPETCVKLLAQAWQPTSISEEASKIAIGYVQSLPAPDLGRDLVLNSVSNFVQGEKQVDAGAFKVARLLVLEIPQSNGIFLACPHAIRALFPRTGDEGFVSPSALELVLAECKPFIAGVNSPNRVPSILENLEANKSREPDVLRAKAQVDKARRGIERRRWIEYYRRRNHAS